MFRNNNKSALKKHFRDSSPTLLRKKQKKKKKRKKENEKENQAKGLEDFPFFVRREFPVKSSLPRNIKPEENGM